MKQGYHEIKNKYKIGQEVWVAKFEYVSDILEPIIYDNSLEIDDMFIKNDKYYYYRVKNKTNTYGELIMEQNIFKNKEDAKDYIKEYIRIQERYTKKEVDK